MSDPQIISKPNLTSTSIKRFLKLAEKHELAITVHATKIIIEPKLYVASSKTHQAGDVSKPGREQECVFLLITNGTNFATQAAWYDGKFAFAHIGGQGSGYRPPKLFSKITEAMKEIDQCLS